MLHKLSIHAIPNIDSDELIQTFIALSTPYIVVDASDQAQTVKWKTICELNSQYAKNCKDRLFLLSVLQNLINQLVTKSSEDGNKYLEWIWKRTGVDLIYMVEAVRQNHNVPIDFIMFLIATALYSNTWIERHLAAKGKAKFKHHSHVYQALELLFGRSYSELLVVRKEPVPQSPPEIRDKIIDTYGPVETWKFEPEVVSFKDMFAGLNDFNEPIGMWDVSNVFTLEGCFAGLASFNQPIGSWDVSRVVNMDSTFRSASMFNQPIGDWNVTRVAIMNNLFHGALKFNHDISTWHTPVLRECQRMFNFAVSFNQPLTNLRLDLVENLEAMFQGARVFNQPLNHLNVSNVRDMSHMFEDAYAFSQDLNNWDVRNVEDMEYMFADAYKFNGNVSTWKPTNLTTCVAMFQRAFEFNQSLNEWPVESIQSMDNMFRGAISFKLSDNISTWQERLSPNVSDENAYWIEDYIVDDTNSDMEL